MHKLKLCGVVKKMVEISKPKYFNAVKVEVSKVVLETTTRNEVKFVSRIRLITDLGEITYKPKRQVTKTTEIDGFETEEVITEQLTTTEFRNANKMLVLLNDNAKEKPQEIWLSYAEISRFDERENEEKFYMYMLRNQFESIYYEKFHKSDKSNLEYQQEKKEKYSKEEEEV
jgi:hypothetical protein